MGMALREAEKAYAEEEVPVGAIIVDGKGEVIARAYNRTIGDNDPTAHAEMLAIREAAAKAGLAALQSAGTWTSANRKSDTPRRPGVDPTECPP